MRKAIHRGRWSLAGVICCSLARIAFSQPALEPLQFEQETLPNGLRVIFAPLHQAPVVHVRVIYHVGSKDDPPDRQGFAHLFEHMMFRGSAHVPDGEFVRLIRRVGGVYNGETEPDITSYFETVPRNQLDLVLYLEADRMAGIRVTSGVLPVERNVVFQELLRRDDSPEVALIDELPGRVFQTHPYRWSPAGNPHHLIAAATDEFAEFGKRFYIPNNAILVITGDFEIAAAREMVQRRFGTIAAGREIVRAIPAEAPQTAPRHVELARRVPAPMLLFGCRVPAFGSDDQAVVTVLAEGIWSRLRQYLELNNHPQCATTFAQSVSMEQDGFLYFGVELLPGADLAAVQRIINVRLDLLRSEGILMSERDFDAFITDVCSSILGRRRTVEGLAEQIGRGALLCSQPDASDRLLARMRQLTAPQVFAAAGKYLRTDGMTTMLVLPTSANPAKGPAASASVDDKGSNAAPTSQPSDVSERQAIPATSASGVAPISLERVPFQIKPADEFMIDGLRVVLLPGYERRRVELRMVFPHGSLDDPKGEEGLGLLTLDLMLSMAQQPAVDTQIGMQTHAPFAYRAKLLPDETEIAVSAPLSHLSFLLTEMNWALTRELDTGLFGDSLTALKWKIFSDGRALNERAESAAERELRQMLFPGVFLGREVTAESLRAISRAEVDVHRRLLLDLNGATILITGQFSPAEARLLVGNLFKGFGQESVKATENGDSGNRKAGSNLILVDDPDSQRSVIRVGSSIARLSGQEFAAAEIGEWILAQRIFRVVRSEQGYAYVPNAAFSQLRSQGMFTVQAETSPVRTGTTLGLLLEHVRRMGSENVEGQELEEAKEAYAGRLLAELQTPQQQATWAARERLRGEIASPVRRIAEIQRITAGQIRDLFAKTASTEKLATVIVGPATTVKPQLESVGQLQILPMPNRRPGAATRPAYEEIPRPM